MLVKRILVILLSCQLMAGCTFLGAKLGEEIDSGDSDTYEKRLRTTGIITDLALIYLIIAEAVSESEHNKHTKQLQNTRIDPTVCDTESQRLICTRNTGCYCQDDAPLLTLQ